MRFIQNESPGAAAGSTGRGHARGVLFGILERKMSHDAGAFMELCRNKTSQGGGKET